MSLAAQEASSAASSMAAVRFRGFAADAGAGRGRRKERGRKERDEIGCFEGRVWI